MYSYDIDHFIRVLEGHFAPRSIDDNSKGKVKELYALIDGMKPTRENSERRSFWIRVPNGDIADFTKQYIDRFHYEDDETDDLSTEAGRKSGKITQRKNMRSVIPESTSGLSWIYFFM